MRVILLLSAIFFLSNCKAPKKIIANQNTASAPKIFGAELAGTWQAEHLWGIDNTALKPSYIIIDFENKTFRGNSGCNDIMGKFSFNNDYILFDKNITTGNAYCTGYNEKKFLDLLLKINRFEVVNDMLELSQDNIVLMTFKRS